MCMDGKEVWGLWRMKFTAYSTPVVIMGVDLDGWRS